MKAVHQKLTKYISFNMLGTAGLSCYILADTYFVAKGLGSNGLAALNIALPIYNLIYGVGMMIGMPPGFPWKKAVEKRPEPIYLLRPFIWCSFLD